MTKTASIRLTESDYSSMEKTLVPLLLHDLIIFKVERNDRNHVCLTGNGIGVTVPSLHEH